MQHTDPAADIATEPPPFDWRAHLRIHPAAELFPLISEAELKQLADDISAHGLRTSIILGQQGIELWLVDGRNRLDVLQRLGLLSVDEKGQLHLERKLGDCWYPFVHEDRRDPYDLVLSLNVHRRHLTSEQKRELIAALLKAKPEASNVTIAKQVKADDKTVAKARDGLESTLEIPRLEKTVGADGKARKRPVKIKPKPGPTASKDIALDEFNGHVLRLLQMTGKAKPGRFAKTNIAASHLLQLGQFLTEVAGAVEAGQAAS